MTTVVLPTLAVAASWFLFGLVILGCGFVTRIAMLPRRQVRLPRAADLWIGLGALVLYLLIWNEFAGVTWYSWLVPGTVGVVGLAIAAARLRGLELRRPRWWLIGVVAVAVAGLANQALGPAQDYDLGLYHLGLVRYAEHYAAIPGLANLQARFGAPDGHLLLVAFLDHGPWAGAAPHLADGLLAAMLAADLGSRFVFRPAAGWSASFANRMALLVAPAVLLAAANRPTHRISSPNLDFAAFVLVCVGMLYLAEAVESGFVPTPVVAAGAALGTAAATRPLYWFLTAVAVVLPVAAAGRRKLLRPAIVAGALPALLFVATAARATVLSGYPFFPATTLRLPFDWRVPLRIVVAQNTANHVFAIGSPYPASVVLHTYHWVKPWFDQHIADPDIVLPMLLLVAAVLALGLAPNSDPGRARRGPPMLAVVLPCFITLIAWFFIAPDTRFVWGPIWLIPIALLAWAVPTNPGRPSVLTLLLGAGAAVLIVHVHDHGNGRSAVPAAVEVAICTIIVLRLTRKRPGGVTTTGLLTAFTAGLAIILVLRGLTLVHATPGGPLGTPPLPKPTLVPISNAAGLDLTRPKRSDQCWGVILCIPTLQDPGLRQRGSTISDGFKPAP